MNWKLKQIIAEKFRTQADFAEAVKTHDSTVSRVVCGRRQLDDAEKARWCEALGVELAELLFPDQDGNND